MKNLQDKIILTISVLAFIGSLFFFVNNTLPALGATTVVTPRVTPIANNTFTGDNTFNATTTFNGNVINSKEIYSLTASTTFTGATTPQPAYIATTTGALLLADANDNDTYYQFDGFVISSGGNGDTVLLQTKGIVDGFTGLTAGSEYFVSDTVGTISTTMGTNPLKIGDAISTTQLLIKREKRLGTAVIQSHESVNLAYTDGYVNGNGGSGTNSPSCIGSSGDVSESSSTGSGSSACYIYFFVERGNTYTTNIEDGNNSDQDYTWIPYN